MYVGDRMLARLTQGAGVAILIALAGVATFLVVESLPGITATADDASALDGGTFISYALPLLFGTVWSSVIALVLAVPLALGVALFLTQFAPPRLAIVFGYLIDLLAAVPSVVYGLWGIAFIAPKLAPIYAWLAEHFGFIPFFNATEPGTTYAVSVTGRTMLTAGVVLALMVIPIITALCREIFSQTPRAQIEAALALGATRAEAIRLAVLPHSRSGIIGATMLGLGRALGETMAVAMVLSASGVISFRLLSSTNPATIPANIALGIKESSGLNINVLIASGLLLFVLSFAVNLAARAFVARRARLLGANK